MLTQWFVASLAIGVTVPSLPAQSTSRSPCESIQYGFVDVSKPSPAKGYQEPRTGKFYALKDTTVLAASAIERVTVWPHRLGSDTVFDVFATLTPSAAGTFAAVTEAHIGQTIAVRVGDDIVATAIVESKLGKRLPFTTNASKARADSLATRVNRATAGSCRSQ